MSRNSQLSYRIALVEDHERMAALIQRAMAMSGVAVDVFQTQASAWYGLRTGGYALAIIDRGLGDGDGLDLVRRLRAAGQQMPCLMLTARDALHDRVAGLEAGADDYLPKPFAMEELVARVRALMRRPPELRDLQLVHGDLVVSPESASLECGGERVGLAPAELQIVICLVRAEGNVVRRASLEAAAWGSHEAVTPNALDVALHRLRRKLEAIGSELSLVNIRGLGFALRRVDVAA
ncbi:response regulator transcription factor [Pseudoxanthomonas suwonensis]|jgi:Response regulators consisting of a CheY-like receiver domain and a winged-helix DNA-binding domain